MSLRALAIFLAVTTSIAFADGGFFPHFASDANSADQRAVIIHADGRETLVLQTAYSGDDSGFAWVVPTPTQVSRSDVAEGDAAIFDELYWITEPRAYEYGRGGGFGCSGGSAGDASEQYAGVNVWDEFSVADYDVAVLSAADSANLGKWLNDNGYDIPEGSDDELAHYVAKSWFFVALKIAGARDGYAPPGNQEPIGGGKSEPMKPLQITFDTPRIVFPMRISAVSSKDEVAVLLYVLAEHRVEGDNYATATVKAGPGFTGSDFSAYYEGKFREALASVGPQGLVTEYAGWMEGWSLNNLAQYAPMPSRSRLFLTRLKTFLQPQDMTEDIVLTQAASDSEFQVALASSSGTPATGQLALAGLLLLGAMMSARYGRGQRLGARGILAILAVLCVLL